MRINDDLVPVVVSATEPTGYNRKKIWKQFSENLWPYGNKTVNENAYSPVQGLCRLEQGQTYTISFNIEGIISSSYQVLIQVKQSDFSGYDGTEIGRRAFSNNSGSYTFTAATEYVLIKFFRQVASSNSNIISNIMLGKGNTVLSFEPYTEGKEYILNNNNVYEEFNSYLIEKVLTLETKMNQIYSNGKVKAEFEAISLPQSGVDLNNYTNSGFYYCRMDGWAQSYSNCPSQYAFGLLVIKHVNCFQMVIPYANSPYGNNAPRIFVRNGATSNTGGWTSWKVLSSWS